MIQKELLSPTNLPKAKTFNIYELLEIVVISKDKNFIFAIFQEVASSFTSFSNS